MFSLSSSFDKALDEATSPLLLEPDWSANLAICDMIRQRDVQPSTAVASVKKRLSHQNPHVALLTLHLLEAMVKNCGEPLHDEVCSGRFMSFVYALTQKSPNLVVEKVLQLLKTWAHAFRNNPRYVCVEDTVRMMKTKGYNFDEVCESDAMFSTETTPKWQDGDTCYLCRDTFTTFNRKHHCRACGQVFCSKCSSNFTNIPKLGVERDVRVCNTCYAQINKVSAPVSSAPLSQATTSSASAAASSATATAAESDLPPEYLASPLSKQSQAPPKRSESELKEQEELQLALAISQSEAEAKQREKKRMARNKSSTNTSSNGGKSTLKSALKQSGPAGGAVASDRDPVSDPELARYLDRSYWQSRHDSQQQQQQQEQQQPLASHTDARSNTGQHTAGHQQQQQQQLKPDDDSVKDAFADQEREIDTFVPMLCSQLEIFVNRMKSNSSRGRPIGNDTSVQSMFMNITALHSQLLQLLQGQDDKRVHYEWLQDRLAQARDARAALDSLREEHRDQQRRQAEEAQQARQAQMMRKLEIMRQKKQEYLQYQRQMAMQKIQDQEREMVRRYEQQQSLPQHILIQQQQQHQQQQQYMWPQQGAPGYPAAWPPQSAVNIHPHQPPPPAAAVFHQQQLPLSMSQQLPVQQQQVPFSQQHQPFHQAGVALPGYMPAAQTTDGIMPAMAPPVPGALMPAVGGFAPPPVSGAMMTPVGDSFNMTSMANTLPVASLGVMSLQPVPGQAAPAAAVAPHYTAVPTLAAPAAAAAAPATLQHQLPPPAPAAAAPPPVAAAAVPFAGQNGNQTDSVATLISFD